MLYVCLGCGSSYGKTERSWGAPPCCPACGAGLEKRESGRHALRFGYLVLGLLTIAVSFGAGTLLSRSPHRGPPRIVAVSADVKAKQALLRWQTDIPCYSYAEYGTDPATSVSTAVTLAPSTQHSVMLPGLTPSRKYYVRLLVADSPRLESFPYSCTKFFEFTTRPEIRVFDVSVVAGATQAKVSWNTNIRTDTVLQYRDLSLAKETPRDRQAEGACVHSVVLVGLAPATRYTYRIVAKDVATEAEPFEGPESSFTTLAESEVPDERLSDIADDLPANNFLPVRPIRMTPFERDQVIKATRFIDLSPSGLTDSIKSSALSSATIPATFDERLPVYRAWRGQVVSRHPELRLKLPDDQGRRLEHLYLRDEKAACVYLDRCLRDLEKSESGLGSR